MTSPAAGKRRKDQDVIRLIESKHEVEIMDSLKHFTVKFNGPSDTPYEGGVWKIRVMLPDDYPFKSPSIGFINRIFHPNIDEASGTVCLDVINQTWTPVFDLVNIFESFLPQLLTYPNAADPLNGEAASMLMSRPSDYEGRIRECVKKYATQEAYDNIRDKGMPLHGSGQPGQSSTITPNRSQAQRSSVSGGTPAPTSGFISGTRNTTSSGGGIGITAGRIGSSSSGSGAGVVSSSMPPAVNFGRGRGTTHQQQQQQQGPGVGQQQPNTISSTSDSHPSGVSNTNNSFVSNLTAPSVGAGRGSATTQMQSNGNVTAVAARNVSVKPPGADDADINDDDDDGEASDLSEFSENEADQMDL